MVSGRVDPVNLNPKPSALTLHPTPYNSLPIGSLLGPLAGQKRLRERLKKFKAEVLKPLSPEQVTLNPKP